jgi:hypothetical protein
MSKTTLERDLRSAKVDEHVRIALIGDLDTNGALFRSIIAEPSYTCTIK